LSTKPFNHRKSSSEKLLEILYILVVVMINLILTFNFEKLMIN